MSTAQKESKSKPSFSSRPVALLILLIADIVPGFVDDLRRILTYPREGHEYDRIHDLPIPTAEETTTILLKAFDEQDPGTLAYDFYRVIGSCRECGDLVCLCVAAHHICKPDRTSQFTQVRAQPFAPIWPPHDWILARENAVVKYNSGSSKAVDAAYTPDVAPSEAASVQRDEEDEPQL